MAVLVDLNADRAVGVRLVVLVANNYVVTAEGEDIPVDYRSPSTNLNKRPRPIPQVLNEVSIVIDGIEDFEVLFA